MDLIDYVGNPLHQNACFVEVYPTILGRFKHQNQRAPNRRSEYKKKLPWKTTIFMYSPLEMLIKNTLLYKTMLFLVEIPITKRIDLDISRDAFKCGPLPLTSRNTCKGL